MYFCNKGKDLGIQFSCQSNSIVFIVHIYSIHFAENKGQKKKKSIFQGTASCTTSPLYGIWVGPWQPRLPTADKGSTSWTELWIHGPFAGLTGNAPKMLVLLFFSRNLLPRGADTRLLPKAARLCRLPDDQEGVQVGMQRRVCGRAVLRTSEEQATEILFRMHWWVFVCGRGREGGEVWLFQVRLLNASLAACVFGSVVYFSTTVDSLMLHSGNIWNIL